MAASPRSVLFLCTGNSARSQLAEALLRHLGGEQFVVMSAGTHPEGVEPRVHQLLAQRGIDSSVLSSKSLAELMGGAELIQPGPLIESVK